MVSKLLLQNMVENTLAKTESSSFSRVFISSLIDGERGFVTFFLLPPFVQLGTRAYMLFSLILKVQSRWVEI